MRNLGVCRGLAILAVVIGHASANAMYATTFWGFKFGNAAPAPDRTWNHGLSYYLLLALAQFAVFSVPVFLFSAGFFASFAAHGNGGKVTWQMVRRWLSTMLIPFAVWIGLALGLDVVAGLLQQTEPKPDFISVLRARAGEYYFVPLLAALYVATPLLGRLTRPRLIVACVVGGGFSTVFFGRPAAQLLGLAVPSGLSVLDNWSGVYIYSGWVTSYMAGLAFYYALGHLIAACTQVQKWTVRWRVPIAASAIICGALSVIEGDAILRVQTSWSAYVVGLSSIFFSTAFVVSATAWQWPHGYMTRQLGWFGRHSLPIYLIQPISVTIALKLVYHLAPWLLGLPVLDALVLSAAGIGGPLLIIVAVSGLGAPRFARLLLGTVAGPRPRANRDGGGAGNRFGEPGRLRLKVDPGRRSSLSSGTESGSAH